MEAKQIETVSALEYQPTAAIQPVLSGKALKSAQGPHALSRNCEQFTDCPGLHHCLYLAETGVEAADLVDLALRRGPLAGVKHPICPGQIHGHRLLSEVAPHAGLSRIDSCSPVGEWRCADTSDVQLFPLQYVPAINVELLDTPAIAK